MIVIVGWGIKAGYGRGYGYAGFLWVDRNKGGRRADGLTGCRICRAFFMGVKLQNELD
jgi:hypothetical protein